MNYDVVVIGAGLAGLNAALAASGHGSRTLMVASGIGTVYVASGLINVLGYYPLDSLTTVRSPIETLEQLVREHPGHPYARVGMARIEEGLSAFLKTCAETGVPYAGSLHGSALFPTPIGTLAPVTFYPAAAQISLYDADSIVVVGFDGYPDFTPSYFAGNLERRLGREVIHLRIDADVSSGKTLNSFDLAALIERKGLAGSIAGKLKASVKEGALLLFPAVLGLRTHREIVSEIERTLACRVGEVPTLPPSVPGYRLAEALKEELVRRDVDIISGGTVTFADVRGTRCHEIGITAVAGRLSRIKAAAFVLATGGILGEGLVVQPHGIRETVFGLPVRCDQPACGNNFFDRTGQEISRAGVTVNEDLQPVEPSEGRVIIENVYVAGATLAGFDPVAERSGHAVAIVTGYAAGLLASGRGAPE